jgi:hypothetical protein
VAIYPVVPALWDEGMKTMVMPVVSGLFCVVLLFLLVSVLLMCPLFPLVLSPSSSLCLCS